MADAISCTGCGEAFKPPRRGQIYCSKACMVAARKRQAHAGCSVDGCDNAHLARTVCSTHWNLRYGGDQRHARRAVPCAVCGTVVMRKTTNRYQHVCSPECRQVVQLGAVTSNPYDWTADAMRRAREAGATDIDVIDRLDVFDRDAWTCYLCDQVVTLGDCFMALSATVDHIVPLSKGGAHTLSNVATCCLMCNSIKAAALDVIAT